jgi:organic radical activating enzyme
MLSKPVLPFLETMITQACNISCVGCTNYSDLTHPGYVSWQSGQTQIQSWLDRVDIPDFGIMGGEPLINPEVREWIQGCRDLMPDSQIRFTTNGLLLHKHFDIIDLLSNIGNCVFKITVHVENTELEDIVNRVHSMYKWEPVVEYGVKRFKTDRGFRFQINRPTEFVKTYQNSYRNMMPYHSDPAQAFDKCCQQTCPLLYNSNIYKCSTAGLLSDVLARFDNPNVEHWMPYLTDGIDPNCSDVQLSQFIDNFGKPNSICGQCPSGNNGTIIHMEQVSRKNGINI